jgi:MoxR-like ATPase
VEKEMAKVDCWETAESIIQYSRRVLLYGPPGTGKTWFAVKAGLKAEQEVMSLTLTEDGSKAALEGFFKPKGTSEWTFWQGPGTRAWLQGCRLAINEIDHAGPDVEVYLHQLLDDPEIAQNTLPDEENTLIRPSDGFQVVATMNGTPDALPFALRDRFPVCINIDKVHPKAIQALPEDLRHAAENTALVEDEERRVSIRAWMEYAKLRPEIGEEAAAKAVFEKRWNDCLTALRMAKE